VSVLIIENGQLLRSKSRGCQNHFPIYETISLKTSYEIKVVVENLAKTNFFGINFKLKLYIQKFQKIKKFFIQLFFEKYLIKFARFFQNLNFIV
jgi:hypothetical protein